MGNRAFSHEELGSFCLGLAHLIRAGLSAGDALELMARDESDEARKDLLLDLLRRADAGAGLARVLADSKRFPSHVCAMTAAGEETGRLEESLFALADYYEQRARLDRQLRTALLQPLVLLGVLLVVLTALLGWVLPVFDDVYRQLGSSLTGVAGGLLAVGGLLRRGLPVLLVLSAGLIGLGVWLFRSPRGAEKLLALFGGKKHLAAIDAARLTQVLAMALSSGLDPERAMELAVGLGAEGSPFRARCEDCLGRLRGSETLPQALRESGLLPAADCRLLDAGVRGGCADTVMARLAGQARERGEAGLESWLGRVEPTLVLTASLLVGLILLSVLLPLTRIMAAIG